MAEIIALKLASKYAFTLITLAKESLEMYNMKNLRSDEKNTIKYGLNQILTDPLVYKIEKTTKSDEYKVNYIKLTDGRLGKSDVDFEITDDAKIIDKFISEKLGYKDSELLMFVLLLLSSWNSRQGNFEIFMNKPEWWKKNEPSNILLKTSKYIVDFFPNYNEVEYKNEIINIPMRTSTCVPIDLKTDPSKQTAKGYVSSKILGEHSLSSFLVRYVNDITKLYKSYGFIPINLNIVLLLLQFATIRCLIQKFIRDKMAEYDQYLKNNKYKKDKFTISINTKEAFRKGVSFAMNIATSISNIIKNESLFKKYKNIADSIEKEFGYYTEKSNQFINPGEKLPEDDNKLVTSYLNIFNKNITEKFDKILSIKYNKDISEKDKKEITEKYKEIIAINREKTSSVYGTVLDFLFSSFDKSSDNDNFQQITINLIDQKTDVFVDAFKSMNKMIMIGYSVVIGSLIGTASFYIWYTLRKMSILRKYPERKPLIDASSSIFSYRNNIQNYTLLRLVLQRRNLSESELDFIRGKVSKKYDEMNEIKLTSLTSYPIKMRHYSLGIFTYLVMVFKTLNVIKHLYNDFRGLSSKSLEEAYVNKPMMLLRNVGFALATDTFGTEHAMKIVYGVLAFGFMFSSTILDNIKFLYPPITVSYIASLYAFIENSIGNVFKFILSGGNLDESSKNFGSLSRFLKQRFHLSKIQQRKYEYGTYDDSFIPNKILKKLTSAHNYIKKVPMGQFNKVRDYISEEIRNRTSN